MAKHHDSESDAIVTAPDGADWSSPAARVRWIIQRRFNGNRSLFAQAIGVSHTAANKVAAGQPPGRKLLTAIAQQLGVNASWLLTGVGPPEAGRSIDGGGVGTRVAPVPLPGLPRDHPELLDRDPTFDPIGLFTESQYWLRLDRSQPILRDPSRGFCSRDLLLMDADRQRFPRQIKLFDHLCVVRYEGNLILACVTFVPNSIDTGRAHLEADTFESSPDPAALINEEVYRHYPDGKILHYRRPLKVIDFRGKPHVVPLNKSPVGPFFRIVQYSDILAVWVRMLHRSTSTQIGEL
jgi:hypothetical protein